MGVSILMRPVIVLGSVLLLVCPGIAQQRETDTDRDLRTFYESRRDRAVWIDERGRPTFEALRVVARLRDVAEDGLEPSVYGVEELGRQALALEAGGPFSAVDAAGFDVGLTSSVLRYFRHLHLGRVSSRVLGFHLDHAFEPHDFPEHLRSALSGHSFDRVVETLRPPFVQYRELRRALPEYRGRDPARVRQIELALERLRWLPDVSRERLLLVNIPMFHLWGWDADRTDGIPSIDMAAITGKAGATRTPVFTSAITSVVFNPEWVVPESILKNEILPAIAANSEYLVQHHMEMTRSSGTTRVRQLPGPWNALGPIKFVLPNIHDVYLHGTPAPALFKEERRDFSHGCVRVADPIALAAWVLKGEIDWPLDRIRTVVASGETRSIKVRRPPRVVLFYTTAAVIPEDGTVQFAEDVYGHDARLDAWLQAQSDGVER